MRRKGIYIISVIVLACLVISAFYAPGLVMKVYDYKQQQDYDFQFRPGVDYEAVNTMYVMNREERLSAFARGIDEERQYYVASSKEESDKWDEILGNAFEQELYYLLWDMGILWHLEEMYDSSNLTDWEYYIIYDKEGVAFLCWYLEVSTELLTVRLLVDAMDYTIYYLESYQPDIFNIHVEALKDTYEWSYSWYNFLTLKQYYSYNHYSYDSQLYENIITDAKSKNVSIMEEKYFSESIQVSEDGKEIISEITFEQGKLQIGARFLNRNGEYFGFGIGIDQLRDLLPEDKKGSVLDSFG